MTTAERHAQAIAEFEDLVERLRVATSGKLRLRTLIRLKNMEILRLEREMGREQEVSAYADLGPSQVRP